MSVELKHITDFKFATIDESVAFSCVLDNNPRLIGQVKIWFNCMTEIHCVPVTNIFVHIPIGHVTDLTPLVHSMGCNLITFTPFDSRSPHCNKICQVETFAGSLFNRVVLMDCDTAWIGAMQLPFDEDKAAIYAKIVDRPNPPEQIISMLFEAAGFGQPVWVDVGNGGSGVHRQTDQNNCNGGFYILNSVILPSLNVLWRKWSLWCLDQTDILGNYVLHADQLGFALALRELGLSVTLLPNEWNYPTHLPSAELENVYPRILHYHDRVKSDGSLELTGVELPDSAIRKLNTQIFNWL